MKRNLVEAKMSDQIDLKTCIDSIIIIPGDQGSWSIAAGGSLAKNFSGEL